MFIEASFLISPNWKQPKCPPTEGLTNKLCSLLHVVEVVCCVGFISLYKFYCVVCSHSEILHSNEKNPTTHNHMDKSQDIMLILYTNNKEFLTNSESFVKFLNF